jgi:hypothetical protein
MSYSIHAIQIACLAALLLTAPLLGQGQSPQADWKPATSPLLTPWAKEVAPGKVWPEYPRPQMVRSEWINLNGLWDYGILPIAKIADVSGREHHGSAAGAPAWQPGAGPSGTASLSFDGSSDAIHLPRVVQDDFTIAFWLKTTQKGGDGPWFLGVGLVDGEVAGVTNDFGTALVGNVFALGVGKPDTTIKSTSVINDGRWHHVAATRSRATGALQVFVDGKLEAEGKGGTQALTAPKRLTIGQLQTGINPYRGSLAEVRIYDRVLPVDSISALSQAAGQRGAEAGLVGWWRLNEDWRNNQPTISYSGKILVPFPIESALSGVRKELLPTQLLYYRRTFKAPELNHGKRLLLHFGAVDWETKVFINGKQVGTHRGGYDAFSFDITDFIRPGADNEIVVVVFDPTAGTRGKQNLGSMFNPGGIMYTPCSGIWQTVWLEPVPACRIEDLEITPDVDARVLRLKVLVKGAQSGTKVEAQAFSHGRPVARDQGAPGQEMLLPIPSPRLWTPDDPFLYDLKVRVDGDEISSYFGMRKISLGKDERGITRMLLNGKFVFQAGTLDQGFWPDGIYLAPTDEALRFDVAMMRKLGLNMARKHVKVEPQRWYTHCDRLGLLVWQDMPSGFISRDNTKDKDGIPLTPEIGRQFKAELKAMIDQHRNHPSIIMWVVFNEAWGQHDTSSMTQWVKEMDPTRLVSNASGWFDRRCGDIIDLHRYPGPGSPAPEPTRAAVLGEFGGLGLGIPEHVWTKKNWGYKGTASKEALTKSYVELWRKVHKLKEEAGLSAAVYTQWTDVEAECNGLYTYDRKVLKVDPEHARAAHLSK